MLNPSEISDILKQQLEDVTSQVKFEEVGTVLEVGDGVAHVYGLENVKSNELVEFENGVKGVALNLEESNVGVVLLNNVNKVTENMSVRRTGEIASIPVGEGLLGRVINILGEPIDGKGPISGELINLPLERKAPGVIFRQPVTQPLQTGIKAVDAMIPIGRGQRELIIGDRQIGKTAIAIDTIINQRQNYLDGKPVYCIYVAIGQKASSVASLVHTLEKYGAMDYTVVLPCVTIAHLPELRSENISVIPAGMLLLFMTICLNMLLHTVKFLWFLSVLPVERHIQVISSICIHVCWKGLPR